MPGVITSVRPVFRKLKEPDPRLARLADKIKQVRQAQALRSRNRFGCLWLLHRDHTHKNNRPSLAGVLVMFFHTRMTECPSKIS